MNKLNNRGFLLAESLIVATFVLTVLIYLFSQFKNLMVEYKKTYKYNTVEDIYNLGSINKYLKKNITSTPTISDEQQYVYIFNDNNCNKNIISSLDECSEFMQKTNALYVIYTDSNIEKIKTDELDFNQDLQEFIKKINTKKIENKGRLIAKFKNGNFATIAIEKYSTTVEPLPIEP